MNAVDYLECALARLAMEDFEALPPEKRDRLSDAMYRGHVLAEMAAAEQPFPRVQPRQIEAPKVGILADLRNGHRAE
jgi:hypothetical protein